MLPSTHWSAFRDADAEDGVGIHWTRFVAVYGPPIQQWFVRHRLPHHDAEDVTQRVLLKLYRNIASYDPATGAFRPWLATILRRALLDDVRTQSRHPADAGAGGSVALEVLGQLAGDVSVDDLTSRIDDRGQRLMREAMEAVRASVEPRNWRAFELHELEKRPAAEVAAELGMTTGAVYQARFRILKMIRKEYLRLADRGTSE